MLVNGITAWAMAAVLAVLRAAPVGQHKLPPERADLVPEEAPKAAASSGGRAAPVPNLVE